jgi:hypothetical protein
VSKKQALTLKYQKQYQTNPFGKKLKEMSSIAHRNNIEESALVNDLQLRERKQPPATAGQQSRKISGHQPTSSESYLIALQ